MKNLRGEKLSRQKEIPILEFLWRWKVSTTSAIYHRFYPVYHWAGFTCYQRMLKLKKKGYIDCKLVDSGTFYLWILTKKGFQAIRGTLPPLREEGFMSEAPEHDLYVLAAHYGDWIVKDAANDVAFITEQELRRQDKDSFFSWMPSVNCHRPDGYWYFEDSMPKSLIALEVEINRKAHSDYVSYTSFYNKNKCINSVIWIVQSQSLARKISSAAQTKWDEYRDIHNFILFEEFLKKGWDAKIFMGLSAKSTMREFLNKHRLNQLKTISKPTINLGLALNILDFNHRRFKSATYGKTENLPLR